MVTASATPSSCFHGCQRGRRGLEPLGFEVAFCGWGLVIPRGWFLFGTLVTRSNSHAAVDLA